MDYSEKILIHWWNSLHSHSSMDYSKTTLIYRQTSLKKILIYQWITLKYLRSIHGQHWIYSKNNLFHQSIFLKFLRCIDIFLSKHCDPSMGFYEITLIHRRSTLKVLWSLERLLSDSSMEYSENTQIHRWATLILLWSASGLLWNHSDPSLDFSEIAPIHRWTTLEIL